MDGDQESELLRYADTDEQDDAASAERPGDGGNAAIVCTTQTVTTYPTAAGKYFSVKPISVFGAETEGAAGTTTAFGAKFFAFNIGTAIPAPAQKVICHFIGNRWIFQHDG